MRLEYARRWGGFHMIGFYAWIDEQYSLIVKHRIGDGDVRVVFQKPNNLFEPRSALFYLLKKQAMQLLKTILYTLLL